MSVTIKEFTLHSESQRSDVVNYCLDNSLTKVGVSWPVGAWKSTFVRTFCVALGVHSQEVTSPTYTWYNEYTCTEGSIIHADMRRADSSSQLMLSWTYDALGSSAYCFVERPKRTEEYMDSSWAAVTISYEADGVRIVTISSSDLA